MFTERKSIRLPGYDYAQEGMYYVTICVQDRMHRFGEIVGATLVVAQEHEHAMALNDAGRMVEDIWLSIPKIFPNVTLDEYIVMPNHFHGIVAIDRCAWATKRVAPTLGQIIGAYKSITTNQYIFGVKCNGWPAFDGRIWHRNYYEHIIRDQDDLVRIRAYIRDNPKNWERDRLHP